MFPGREAVLAAQVLAEEACWWGEDWTRMHFWRGQAKDSKCQAHNSPKGLSQKRSWSSTHLDPLHLLLLLQGNSGTQIHRAESKQPLVSTQTHFSSPEASPLRTSLHQILLMHPVNHREEVFPAEALDLTMITLMVLFQGIFFCSWGYWGYLFQG